MPTGAFCPTRGPFVPCISAQIHQRQQAGRRRGRHSNVKGSCGKNELLRTKDSVKTLTVPSMEELNTRSMSVFARPCDFLVAVGSHAPDTDSSRASSPSRHFVARARMGLRGGVRARINTVSTTVHRSLDAVARKKSHVLTPAASRVRKLSLFF